MPMSYTRPGSAAPFGFTMPPPKSNGSASFLGDPSAKSGKPDASFVLAAMWKLILIVSYSFTFLEEKYWLESLVKDLIMAIPVVTNADLIAAGDQSGCIALRSATMPET